MPTIQVMFNQQKISSHALEKEVYTIGRQEGCDIHIDNLGVSRVHARLLKAEQGYFVEDMNSSNGTFVNGQRVSRQALGPGDQITIGKFTLIYEIETAQTVQEAPPPSANAPAGKPLPPLPGDMLGTMQMDAETIRKRIEEMQRKKQEEMPAPAVAASKSPSTSAPPAPSPTSSAGIKILLAVLGIAVLALVAAVIYLLMQR